ncbi:MAG: VanW family protein [Clostridia bacterium]
MEDEPGGGVCQTSATLYHAVLLAGMEIVERAHHSFPVFYAEPGFDATVNYPVTDFKFRSTMDTPIFLVSYEAGNELVVEVYGAPLSGGIRYKLEKEVYEEIPAPEPKLRQDFKKEFIDRIKYKDEEYVWVESRKGIKARTYRVTLKEGREIGGHLIADDFYRPIKGITYIGVEERPLRDLFAPNNENSTNEVISLTLGE